MKNHKIIKIEGRKNYYCRLDSRGLIVKVDPDNKHLLFKNISDVFKKYSKKLLFTKFENVISPDLIVSEDVAERMREKNPNFSLLEKVFQTEIV